MGKKNRNRRSKAAHRNHPSSSAAAPPFAVEPEAPPIPPPPPSSTDCSSDPVSVVTQGSELDEFFEKHRCGCHEKCDIILSQPQSPIPHHPPPDLSRRIEHHETATTTSSSNPINIDHVEAKKKKKKTDRKSSEMSKLMHACRASALDGVEEAMRDFRNNPAAAAASTVPEALMKRVSMGMIQMQDVLVALNDVVDGALDKGGPNEELAHLHGEVMTNVSTIVQAYYAATQMIEKKKKEEGNDGAGGKGS